MDILETRGLKGTLLELSMCNRAFSGIGLTFLFRTLDFEALPDEHGVNLAVKSALNHGCCYIKKLTFSDRCGNVGQNQDLSRLIQAALPTLQELVCGFHNDMEYWFEEYLGEISRCLPKAASLVSLEVWGLGAWAEFDFEACPKLPSSLQSLTVDLTARAWDPGSLSLRDDILRLIENSDSLKDGRFGAGNFARRTLRGSPSPYRSYRAR